MKAHDDQQRLGGSCFHIIIKPHKHNIKAKSTESNPNLNKSLLTWMAVTVSCKIQCKQWRKPNQKCWLSIFQVINLFRNNWWKVVRKLFKSSEKHGDFMLVIELPSAITWVIISSFSFKRTATSLFLLCSFFSASLSFVRA